MAYGLQQCLSRQFCTAACRQDWIKNHRDMGVPSEQRSDLPAYLRISYQADLYSGYRQILQDCICLLSE
jgi:hypothetical protein